MERCGRVVSCERLGERSVVVFQVDNEHGGLRCCNRIDEENDGVTKKKRALHREDSLVVVSQREMGV